MRSTLTVLASAVLLSIAAPAVFAAPVPGIDYAALVERNTPSVVYIEVKKAPEKKADKGDTEDVTGQGSGFVFDAVKGFVITNAHVVSNAKTVTLTLADKRKVVAKVIGKDERTDVAVLKVDTTGLRAVQLGEPAKLRVGDPVMALGAPYGLEMSASAGIVSAKNRTLGTQFVPFIQTDAAVNPGNSGGPLFNAKGEVIGITSQIYSKSGGFAGLSFAIPIDIAARVALDLIDDGKVTRSKVGVSLQPVTDEMAQAFGLPHEQGALITFIDEKGPGKAAGLQVGDIVVKADGHPVVESLDLPRYVSALKPGSSVTFTVWREGKLVDRVAKVAPMDDEKAAMAPDTPAEQRVGMVTRALTADEREQLQLKQGTMLEAVKKDSPAAKAGLKTGDVLLSLRQTPLASITQLRDALEKEKSKLPVLVLRSGARVFVVLDLTPAAAE